MAAGWGESDTSERENAGLSARSLPFSSCLSFFFLFSALFAAFIKLFPRASLVAVAPFFDTAHSIEFHLSSTLRNRASNRLHLAVKMHFAKSV